MATKRIQKDVKRMYASLVAACIIFELIFVVIAYNITENKIKIEAKAHAEEMATRIQTELYQSYETTELLEDLYKVYGNMFLQDFNKICNELTKDNLAIGSMYFAPQGIIKYSYPDEVDQATSNFNMLEDPIQGPKAQKAIDDRKTTIAGPHNLIEGGQGFIIRNPLFYRDAFIAFTILILDKDRLVSQISQGAHTDKYDFAVWKEPDPTANVDENGFIISSRKEGKPISRDVYTSFSVLNDTWYVALEPTNGWNVLEAMRIPLVLSLVIFVILLFLFFLHTMAVGRKRQLNIQIFSNQAKSSFLFNMSHDIRTPMNAIIGFADLMKKNLDDREKLENYLDKLHYSSNFLLSLINNVLEMAKIESGKMILDENIISTQQFEDVTEAVFTDIAKDKGLTFSNDYHLIHDYVIGDEMKIRELTLNIVSNAIKYTPAGGFVKLSLLESKCDKPGYTLFTAIAEDSGIGISPDYLPHIFEEFSREKNSTESKISGTGLGMPIVKKLIDLMEGTIDIQSQQGKGTKVTITLPLRLPTEEQIAAAKQAEAKLRNSPANNMDRTNEDFLGKRILLAEDNDLNAEIAIAVLTEMGFAVERAVDGSKCLQMLEQQDAGYYDLILMDIQMPIMDGYQATQAIRNLNDPSRDNIPIIAMTANAFNEDRQKALETGMNGHVAKPIDVGELTQALSTVLKQGK